ncbi:SPFH domain-containing protein [Roseateles depolymerans]|uniref:Spfh domain / band 7 family protein n=1 Tax=Roseateles depolymerans TaxID=76731 RepID=A0A0U3LLR8_9BURK|nr:SPFH domain-containing protein [Roseateles depolymerans]ALV09055.1 spfh domain / band 7 family protein [Roseateles depolymerans]REG10137.1 regulator of protease activity HflC (stomatin/prohibitin superfamily) [Roseateles depolymerans]
MTQPDLPDSKHPTAAPSGVASSDTAASRSSDSTGGTEQGRSDQGGQAGPSAQRAALAQGVKRLGESLSGAFGKVSNAVFKRTARQGAGGRAAGFAGSAGGQSSGEGLRRVGRGLLRCAPWMLGVTAVAAAIGLLVAHPPAHEVPRGEVSVRQNLLTGSVVEARSGTLLVVPGLHTVRDLPLRDRSYQPTRFARADGEAPLQSLEGLSLGLDLTVRWALDSSRMAALASSLPDDIEGEVIAPALQGIVYRQIATHTVREIFSTQRGPIQQALEAELRSKLAADGIVLRSVQIGNVDLPQDYRTGLETLLSEGLASEKMRYTLELQEKKVRQTELEAAADKVRRETAAEAAAREQVIAARGQEEAMKHVLPFKQRQVEQRQLEAEADRVSRIRMAEGAAQARSIEADGEAKAREKLADAEAYRQTRIGKVAVEQMAAEGALLSRHPLLIQKAMADKLSDKVQVIIAPPPSDGGFIGKTLLGSRETGQNAAAGASADGAQTAAARTQQEQE